jgi:hypothetical protein
MHVASCLKIEEGLREMREENFELFLDIEWLIAKPKFW